MQLTNLQIFFFVQGLPKGAMLMVIYDTHRVHIRSESIIKGQGGQQIQPVWNAQQGSIEITH